MTCETCGNSVADGVACSACSGAVMVSSAQIAASPSDAKSCPFCGEAIKAHAIKCRYCGSTLNASAITEPVAQAASPAVSLPGPGSIALSAPAGGGWREPSIVIQNVQSSPSHSPLAIPTKNPGLAVLLSFFFTGLGQFYNGDIGKGLLLMMAQAVNLLLMFFVVGYFTGFMTWVYGMVDAHRSARRVNARGY